MSEENHISLVIKETPDKEDIEVMVNVADAMMEGKGFVRDVGAALLIYKKAASFGVASGYRGAGEIYLDFGEEKRGIIYLKKAASMGDTDAMVTLGKKYLDEGETKMAEECFKRASEDNPQGMLGIGMICENRGDLDKALSWYRKAYDMGNRKGADLLAGIYDKKENDDLAVFWYRQAGNKVRADEIRKKIEDVDVEIVYAKE